MVARITEDFSFLPASPEDGDDEVLIAASVQDAGDGDEMDRKEWLAEGMARRIRLQHMEVRDWLLRRTLEAAICFQLSNVPAYRTRFERLKVETDPYVVVAFLFHDDAMERRVRDVLAVVQKRLGLPENEWMTLEGAVAMALPAWRRGGLQRNSKRLHQIGSQVEDLCAVLHGLPGEERHARYRLMASPRDARELVEDGAVRPEELAALAQRPPLVESDGAPRQAGYEVVEELRYRILRTPGLLRPSAKRNEMEAA